MSEPSNCKVAALCFAILVMALLVGCKDRVPAANTPAFNELHGIVNDGKTINEIILINDRNGNRPQLRFPPEIGVTAYTPHTHDPNPKVIRRGFAYEVAVTLALDQKKRLVPPSQAPKDPVYSSVHIRLGASQGPEDRQRTEARLKEIAQLSVRTMDNPEWGLREYVLLAPKTDTVMAYEYLPLDENLTPFHSETIRISCHATGGSFTSGDHRPSTCASHYFDYSGVSVSYRYDSRLLAYWYDIYREVFSFTDSVLIK